MEKDCNGEMEGKEDWRREGVRKKGGNREVGRKKGRREGGMEVA